MKKSNVKPPKRKTKKSGQAWAYTKTQSSGDLLNQIVNKIKLYLKGGEFTFDDLDMEFNRISHRWMNLIQDIEETKFWTKPFKICLFSCNITSIILLVVNIILYTKSLVERIELGLFLILYSFGLFVARGLYFHQLSLKLVYEWLRDYHNRKLIFIEQMLEDGQSVDFRSDIPLTLSMAILKTFQGAAVVATFLVFVLYRIINTVMSKDIFDLAPIPLYVPGLDATPILRYFILTVTQLGGLMFSEISLLIGVCILFVSAIHIFCIVIGVLKYIKFKKESDKTKEDEEHYWIRNLIDTTDQLKEKLNLLYETFSEMLYFMEKMCFAAMVVLWLAVKIEPGLIPLTGLSVLFVQILFVQAIFNELMVEKYTSLTNAIYDLYWYTWKAKEQKNLIPIIGFLQRPPQFKAIIEDLTLTWFTDFMKASIH